MSAYLRACAHSHTQFQPLTTKIHPNSYHCKYPKRTRQPRDFHARRTRRSALLLVWRIRRCVINLCPKSARPGSQTPPPAMPVSRMTMLSVACPKCNITKKSGTLSCCARGGAWFKNCGDVGDTQFDHTWAEGIEACTSRLLTC